MGGRSSTRVEGKDRERPLVRFGSEEQGLSDPLNGHLAQSDLVTLVQGLKEAGFVDSQNVLIEARWAEGNYARRRQLWMS